MDLLFELSILVAVFCAPFCRVEGQHIETLGECAGRNATFSYKHNPTGYRRITYSFSDKKGSVDIYKRKFNQKPDIHPDYTERFSITSTTAVGFTLSNVRNSDVGNFTCYILYNNGSDIWFRWILRVEDSSKLCKPTIVLSTDEPSTNESKCRAYSCSHSMKEKLTTYWIHSGDTRTNGSSLLMCDDNRSQVITCVIKSFCRSNYTVFNTTKENEDIPPTLAYISITVLIVGVIVLIVWVIVLIVVILIMCRRSKYKDERTRTRSGTDVQYHLRS